MKTKTIILLIFLSSLCIAKDYSCLENFNWIKKTFEENDAGFEYAVSIKGVESYKSHNTIYSEKTKSIQEPLKCNQALYQWLKFFRKGHIAIRATTPQTHSSEKQEPSKETLKNRYKDWQSVDISENELKKYLDNSKLKKSPLEGIWLSPPYTIGIQKIDNQLIGFIIDAKNNYWSKGQIKLKINSNGTESTFYMRDHSAVKSAEIKLQQNKYLKIGNINLKRLYPVVADDKAMEQYFKLMQSNEALVEKLSDNTVLLRIPSFAFSNKKQIDKIIKENQKLIKSTKNLIIDIRNNGGGSDSSYEEIIPFLYTNPIRTIGVKLLSTNLNNQRMQRFANNEEWTKPRRKWAKNSLKKLNKHIGEFVNLNDNEVSTKTLKKVFKYPKNVAILINQNNGSTAEQFLLAAKQSRKVKLYGVTTVGILDISNMNFVKSPDGTFELGYSLSRSYRIPDMAIDNKGILPDYFMDKSIPNHQWINHVQKLMN